MQARQINGSALFERDLYRAGGILAQPLWYHSPQSPSQRALTGEIRKSGLPCHGHGHLAVAVKKSSGGGVLSNQQRLQCLSSVN